MKRTLVALLVCASLFPWPGRPRRPPRRPPGTRLTRAQLFPVPRVVRSGRGRATRPHGRRAAPPHRAVPAAGRALSGAGRGRAAERGDCRAIRRFQRAHRIAPATGYAGRATGAAVRLMRARKDPNRAGRCPDRPERTVCADLNRQLLWVQQGGAVIFDPVTIRSGQPTMETRTGTYRIYRRSRNHTSNLYHTPMPFAQFFDRGEALHGVYEDIYAGAGSHGCINLTWSDARRLWDLLKKGDVVHVWGRKPVG
ncbi:L,D-transpeptidase family protein [Streptomyces lydicus]|nr:L,D-transpeptidase family protein [Streptomyces lydicus]